MADDEDFVTWVRDHRGRVGKLSNDQTRILYASGEQSAPLPECYGVITDAFSAQYEFSKQRDAMWAACCELDSLNRRVLARMIRARDDVKHGSLRYEELLADVGLKTMRSAALLYDAAKCGESLRGYVGKCLRRAYARALSGSTDPDRGYGHAPLPGHEAGDRGNSNRLLDTVIQHSPVLGGLEHAEQLSTIIEAAGLTSDEVQLLLSRFDSEESLRDLADQLDVSSPQTVLNSVNRILERCRRAAS